MGSRKGSPNRNKAFLLRRLQDMYGEDFHPIIKIAENCKELQALADKVELTDDSSPEEQTGKINLIRCANAEWGRISEYTEPKLKAMELSGDADNPVAIQEITRTIIDE